MKTDLVGSRAECDKLGHQLRSVQEQARVSQNQYHEFRCAAVAGAAVCAHSILRDAFHYQQRMHVALIFF